jgi:hypothetical protein
MNPPSTPSRAGPSTSTETPSRPRQYGSNRYLSGVLGETRSIVVEDLGEIPLLSVDSFMERVLPPAEDALLKRVKALLVQRKHINKRNRWHNFSKTPKQSGKSETNAFKALPTVFKNIVTAASSISQCPRLAFISFTNPTLNFIYVSVEKNCGVLCRCTHSYLGA